MTVDSLPFLAPEDKKNLEDYRSIITTLADPVKRQSMSLRDYMVTKCRLVNIQKRLAKYVGMSPDLDTYMSSCRTIYELSVSSSNP